MGMYQVRMHKIDKGNYRVEVLQVPGKGNGPSKYISTKSFTVRKDAMEYAKSLRAYYKK